jgi:hypothetical protein
MASQLSSNAETAAAGVSLADLPKSNVFTSKLPPDPGFPTPEASHSAQRERLYPRMVKKAFFTFVRPETTEDPELLGVSPRAMKDIGLKPGEEETDQFKAVVSGNEFFWSEERGGVYPWAQCYGGKSISMYVGATVANLCRMAIVCRAEISIMKHSTDQEKRFMGRAARRWCELISRV